MQYPRLSEFLDVRRQRGEPLVMATVIATSGSTYSKAGERMLIDRAGDYQGMLSGGCLEGDLALHAQRVLERCQADRVSYALDDDEVFGLGVGCEGQLEILLQPLLPDEDYQPFTAIVDAWRQCYPAATAVLLNEEHAGATIVRSRSKQISYRIPVAVENALQTACEELSTPPYREAPAPADTLMLLEMPQPSLLILGAGPDAEPLLRVAKEMGWRVCVCDHRPANIESGRFADADETHCFAPESLASDLSVSNFHAAVVMSHNLAADGAYLKQLAATDVPYLALLGPPRRKQRVLETIADAAIENRLHAPAGLDLGGRGAAAIAVSIVAEIQQAISNGLLTSR